MSVKKTQFKLVNSVLVGAIALALSGCGEDSLTSVNNTSPGGGTTNPTPAPPSDNDSQISSNLIVFTDGANSEWTAWDSSGVTTPSIQVETDQYGAVMEFVVDAPESVFGFVRSSSALDLSGRTGKLVMDVKVTAMPENGDIPWFIKLESNGGLYSGDFVGEEVEYSMNAPVLNQWQRVEIELTDMQSKGLDLSAIDNVLIFPEWGQGAGAVYRVDNVQCMLDSEQDDTPQVPNEPSPNFALFTNTLPSGWVTWDCCGGSDPAVVDSEDADYGSALEFIIYSETVLGITNRVDIGGDGAANLDLSGKLSFDIKLLNDLGEGAAANWFIKIESGFEEQFAELPLPSAPPVGTWTRYTFEAADLIAAGLDVTSIDTILVFPQWGTGLGSHYLIDNILVEGVLGEGSEPPAEEPPVEEPSGDTISIVDSAVNFGWIAWDCCGGSTAETIDSGDVDYGNAVKFVKNIDQTVLGFSSREDHGATDASTVSIEGSLSFDMKLLNDGGSSDWRLKVESGPENFVELSLPSLPAEGEWQNYSFDLQALSSGSLDLTAANVIMVFPAWDTGAGAEYLIDNLVIEGSVNEQDVVEPEQPEEPETPPSDGDTVTVGEGIDFESKTLAWQVFENADNAPLEFVSNPDTTGINASSTAAKIVAKVAGAPWAGTKTEGVVPFTLDSSNGVIKVMVYKSIVSSVVVKVEAPDGEGIWGIEERVDNTKVNEWEELTFDFTQNPAFNAAPSQITGVVIFPDFNIDGGGTPLNRSQDVTMYFDNVSFNGQ